MDIIEDATNAFASIDRVNVEEEWRKIAHYCSPHEEYMFGGGHTPNAPKSVSLYTNEAILAGETLASTLRATVINESAIWLKPEHKGARGVQTQQGKEWIDSLALLMMGWFANSNFYPMLGRLTHTACVFGTGVLLAEERQVDGQFVGLTFRNLHLSQCAWSEGADGLVDTAYIKETMPIRVVKERYLSDKDLPLLLGKMLAKDKNATTTIYTASRPVKNGKGRFEVIVSEELTKAILSETTSHSQAIIIPRWNVSSGTAIGHGCGHTAVFDASVLDTMRYENLQSKALVNRPPVLTQQDNVLGQLSLASGSLINVSSVEGVKALDLGINMQGMATSEEDLKLSIQRSFLLDKLSLPPRTSTGEMSAYETSRRIREMNFVVAGSVTMFYSELIALLGQRVLSILYANSELGDIPEEFAKEGEIPLNVSFTNQLARSQEQAGIQALQDSYQILSGMSQTNPTNMLVYEDDTLALDVCKDLGVPPKFVATQEKFNEKKQQYQETMEKEQQAKQAEMLSKIHPNEVEGQ